MTAALIERLEKASAGDRVFDALVIKASDPGEWERCRQMAARPCGATEDVMERDAIRFVPPVTTSLDAALALAVRVLPGWRIDLSKATTGGGWAEIGPDSWAYYENASDAGGVQAGASTPALALCIAILKARTAAPDKLGGDEPSSANAQKQNPLQEGVKP